MRVFYGKFVIFIAGNLFRAERENLNLNPPEITGFRVDLIIVSLHEFYFFRCWIYTSLFSSILNIVCYDLAD